MTRSLILGSILALSVAPAAMAGGLAESIDQTETQVETAETGWTGGYWGAFVGASSGSYQQGVTAFEEVGPDVDVSGAIVGLRYGRNYQKDSAIYGFDLNLMSGPDGDVAQGTSSAPNWNCNSGDCNVSINALLTVRGRYGKLTDENTLVYGAGGLAIGSYEGGIYNSVQQGTTETNVGFTVGFGVERALTNGWHAFGELNYVDLGTLTFGTDGISDDYDGVGQFSMLQLGMTRSF